MPVSVMVGELGLFFLQLHLEADGSEEWFEVVEKILLRHSGIEIEEVQELSLHQVDFSQPKTEALEPSDGGVSRPVLVLGA